MYDEGLVKRFHTKYERNQDSGCWEWTASLAGKGYGQLKLSGERRQVYAHRISYEIHKGPITDGKYVLHKCDNPKCVNPDHLFLGTHQENQTDMKQKGRSTWGEKSGTSVLTETDVRTIRKLLDEGLYSQEKIAKMFGVQQMQISRIHRRERWAQLK